MTIRATLYATACAVALLWTPQAFAQTRAELAQAIHDATGLYATAPAQACAAVSDVVPEDARDSLSLLAGDEEQVAYYLLATCAYRAGDLDRARHYYERVVALDDLATRPRLDLGTVYLRQGLFMKAERQYREVMNDPATAEEERARLEALLQTIPSRLRADFMISFGIGYDTNVNSGPSDNVHRLYDFFDFTLDPDSQRQKDGYAQTSVAANLSKLVDARTQLLLGASLQRADYFNQSDFGNMTASIAPGIRRVLHDVTFTLTPYYTHQWLDDRRYYSNVGLNASAAVPLDDTWTVIPSARIFHEDFATSGNRTGDGFDGGASLSYKAGEGTTLWASALYGETDARSDMFSHDRVRLGLSAHHYVSEDMDVSLAYQWQRSAYDEADPAFGTLRRDRRHQVTLNVNYGLADLIGWQRTFVAGTITYSKTRSNHSLQENDRLLSLMKMVYNF